MHSLESLALPHPRSRAGAVPESLDLSGAEQFYVGGLVAAGGIPAYEPEVFAMLCALLETSARPAVFLDVGANIGLFALVAKAMFGPGLSVKAFEPMPELAEFVESAAKRNSLAIDVRREALSDNRGTATFYLSAQADTSNSLNRRFRPHLGEIEVLTETLDHITRDSSPASFVVKIDTESTEPDVLEGAGEFVSTQRPYIICEVLAGRTEERLEAWVNEAGYHAFQITPQPHWSGGGPIEGDPTYEHRDWLFAPKKPNRALKKAFRRWMTAWRTSEPE